MWMFLDIFPLWNIVGPNDLMFKRFMLLMMCDKCYFGENFGNVISCYFLEMLQKLGILIPLIIFNDYNSNIWLQCVIYFLV